MKKITLLTLILFSVISYAQVGINTNTPDASSVLDIESTTGGILIPRLTETQRDAISSPATGLMIYQTDQTTGFYFYNGTAWTRIEGVAGPQGEQGPLGPQGPQGVAGADGVDGADGNGILSTTDNNDGTFTLTYTDGSTFTTSDFTSDISDLEAAISYVAAEALSIGDFVGGGVVFWIDPTDNTKGLACALENQSTGIQWYNGVNTTTNATATAIGSGAANTTAIIDNQGPTETDYAAGLARAFNGGGFSDWFLPSKGELSAMFQNKETLNTTISNNGGQIFQNSAYWSSTEIDSEFARAVGFGNGSSPSYYKYSNAHVRAVRAVNSVGTSSELTAIAAEQTAQNSAIDLKANIASPTFTGTVTIPTLLALNLNLEGTAITATPTEINYLDGVTSSIQTQLNSIGYSGSRTFIGLNAGETSQGGSTVAVGHNAGNSNQANNSVAIGAGAGSTSQGQSSIAIGYVAGNQNQGLNSVSIGSNSSQYSQGNQAVSIGYAAGQTGSGDRGVAVGSFSRATAENSVAIGPYARNSNANTVLLGSDGTVDGSVAVTNVKTSGTITAGAITIPNTDGISGQVLATDGSGTLSWTTLSNGSDSVYNINTFYAELGGYVIEVNSNGTHGLVIPMQDQGNCTWRSARDVVKDPANYDVNGSQFRDWRVPTLREVKIMSSIHADESLNFDGFYYMTQSEYNDTNFYKVKINGGVEDSNSSKNDTNTSGYFYRVRAIRSF